MAHGLQSRFAVIILFGGIIIIAGLWFIRSSPETIEEYTEVEVEPGISPDYSDIIIPANIAPINRNSVEIDPCPPSIQLINSRIASPGTRSDTVLNIQADRLISHQRRSYAMTLNIIFQVGICCTLVLSTFPATVMPIPPQDRSATTHRNEMMYQQPTPCAFPPQ